MQLVMAPKLTQRKMRVTPDMFFVRTLLVPPNRFRPEARTGDSQITEAEQNSLYKKILRNCSLFAEIHREVVEGPLPGRRARDMTALHEAWTGLQDCVNSLIDNTKSPSVGAARSEEGIKQIESTITEVNGIFQDLAQIVHEQGYMIGKIRNGVLRKREMDKTR